MVLCFVDLHLNLRIFHDLLLADEIILLVGNSIDYESSRAGSCMGLYWRCKVLSQTQRLCFIPTAELSSSYHWLISVT